MSKGCFCAGKPRAGSRTVVAAAPGAAHPVPVAALLLPPAQHARRGGLVRAVAVPPDLTLLVVSARVGLVGNREVCSEALLCARNGCSPLKKPTEQRKPPSEQTKAKKTNYHRNLQNKITEVTIHGARRCS